MELFSPRFSSLFSTTLGMPTQTYTEVCFIHVLMLLNPIRFTIKTHLHQFRFLDNSWKYLKKNILIYTPLIIGTKSIFSVFLVFVDFFCLLWFSPSFLVPIAATLGCFSFFIDLYDFLICLHINPSSVIHVDWDLKMPCSKHFKGHQVKKLLSEIISEAFPDALCSCLLVSVLSIRICPTNYMLTSFLFSDGAPLWTSGSPASQSVPHLPASELRDHGLCLPSRRTTLPFPLSVPPKPLLP